MRLALIALSSVAVVSLAGCIPQNQYDDLMTAYRSKEQQLLQMQGEYTTARANENMLREQLAQAAADLATAKSLVGGDRGTLDELEARYKALQAQLPSTPAGRERELKEREFQAQAQRLEQVGRAFVDDVERRKAEERRKYFVDVTAIVNKIAESQKFDLVLQEAVFAGKAVDITEQVIKAMGGPAPKPAGK